MVTKHEITAGYTDVNDARLYFETAGESADTLVFVHAGIADHRLWNHQFRHFAQNYLTVRYDMRGYGQSSVANGPYSHTRDLVALLNVLGIDSAVLVGCSLGGTVAVDFTLTYPERVRGLVLVGSNPAGWQAPDGTESPQWDAVLTAFKAGDLERTSELEVAMWVDGIQRTPDAVDPAVRALVYDMNLIVLQNEVASNGATQTFINPDAAGSLEAIETPTFVIAGALDQPATLAAAGEMTARIPNAQKVIIADTAHVPSLERPEVFNAALSDWLETLA